MKTITKGFIATLLLSFVVLSSFGQKGVEDGSKYGHGKDSISCIRNISLYREYYKQNNYTDAINSWKAVYMDCPKASKNIYLDGIKMIKASIKNAESDEQQAELADSLLRIYDKRIKYFGQKGYVLGRKGNDFIRVSKNTVENMQKGYDILSEAIAIRGKSAGDAELVVYFQTSKVLYSAKKFDGTTVVKDYALVMNIIDSKLQKKPDSKRTIRAKDAIEKIFETSGAASADNLIALFEPQFKEKPNDLELLKKIHTLLGNTKGGNETVLYFKVAENLNKIEPKATLAYQLAKRYSNIEKYKESSKYFKQAIELQEDNIEKSNYYLELGDITYKKLGNYAIARSYARKAHELNNKSGYPYMLIGHIYSAATKSCSDKAFEQNAIYWAAVDNFAKAKSINPDLTDKANKYITTFSKYFPDSETIFFNGFNEGDSYKIECWINETTTVRAR
ncbi:MAG: tetratricopeptide repeat protein [Bacteroidota bacterium]|nr:tetratricopeptide repeat protein [Bacteroidota bacterium]